MRRPLVIGNWKMNGSNAENDSLLRDILLLKSKQHVADMAVCVPAVYLQSVSRLLQEQSDHGDGVIGLGAQDVSVHLSGAYTGETSVAMLKDVDCQYVIVGHSERRQYHHESNLLVAQKALTAIKADLTPIICVGETIEHREAGEALDVVGQQLSAVKAVMGDSIANSVIAYEPVWAIGTGLTATPEQAQDVHCFIRQQLGEVGKSISLLYGGSVKKANSTSLFTQADIDGALVGGASLVADEFVAIAAAAAH